MPWPPEWLGLWCPHCGQPVYLRVDKPTPLDITCALCGRTFRFTARMRMDARNRRAAQRPGIRGKP